MRLPIWIIGATLLIALGVVIFFGTRQPMAAPSVTTSTHEQGQTVPAPQPTQISTTKPDVTFTLKTRSGMIGNGLTMAYIGVSGTIANKVDPTLYVTQGQQVRLTLIDKDGVLHDVAAPTFNARSANVLRKGQQTSITFLASKAGTFSYYCTQPGHRQMGMAGKLVVAANPAAAPVNATGGTTAHSTGITRAATSGSAAAAYTPSASPKNVTDVVRSPTDLPPPVGDRPAKLVRVNLRAQEVIGRLANGVSYHYWTYNGKVPGPLIRVRVGDTVELHLSSPPNSHMLHSIDLHAVLGPGGGAAVMQVPPGKQRVFTFKPIHPGLFVYHCGTPVIAEHIANGMFGMILVEPAGGLPKVDHEFYIMQSEVYTRGLFGQKGLHTFDLRSMIREQPTYMVFNGAVGALTDQHPLHAKVGQSVRIFFGDAGPNKISSLHVIGEILNQAWIDGSLSNQPLKNVQTVAVPPGDTLIAELTPRVPGQYVIVDHALGRVLQGLKGVLDVTGPKNPALFHAGPAESRGGR